MTIAPSRVLLANHSVEAFPSLPPSLTERGVQILRSDNIVETARRILEDHLDLVVFQPLTSNIEGIEIRHVLSLCEGEHAPSVLLVLSRPDSLQQLIGQCAVVIDDFLMRPVRAEELALRIEFNLARAARWHSLEQANRTLEQETITDFKTGLYNDRYFFHRLREEVARSKRHQCALSLMVFDFDNFKSINDRFDHVFGDFVLLAFARKLRNEVRNIDIPARLGGDEFALLLPNTDLREAARLAGRLTEVVASYNFERDGRSTQLSLSMGVDCMQGRDSGEAEDFLRRADQALLEAKKRGKNRICLYPEVANQGMAMAAGRST